MNMNDVIVLAMAALVLYVMVMITIVRHGYQRGFKQGWERTTDAPAPRRYGLLRCDNCGAPSEDWEWGPFGAVMCRSCGLDPYGDDYGAYLDDIYAAEREYEPDQEPYDQGHLFFGAEEEEGW